MCGICGTVALSTTLEPEYSRRRIMLMLRAMAHRGPDDVGFTETASAVFGVTRLAIRGLADANQPIVDCDSGVTVVCNGEIDNHRELRVWLAERGRPVQREVDVAVIPGLYLELGERFVEKLVGAFAIALWDPRKSRLILARDRAGERPLFFTSRGNEIIFATEFAALAADEQLSAELNQPALKKYLQFGIFPSPSTPFVKIQKVAPGQRVQFDEGGMNRCFYWRWRIDGRPKEPPSVDSLDQIFRTAVARQTDVDVNFGVFLSGGLDSSLVSAVAQSVHPQRTLNAYTLRFHEDSFDEGNFAEAVAKHLKAELVNVWVEPEDVRKGLKSLVRLVGEPLADPAWIPAALLAQRASKDVKLALVGEGADELFGGYPAYMGASLADQFGRLPCTLRRLIRRTVNALPTPEKKVTISFLLKRFVSGMELNGLSRHEFWISNIAPPTLERLTGGPVESEPSEAEGGCLLDHLQRWDLEHTLAEGLLTKADRSSMSSSLELRAPFLDEAVMEFAQLLPREQRVRRFQTKVFLKQYALRYLPTDIVHRRKRGLSVPICAWLRGPLREWAQAALNSAHLERAGICRVAVRELFAEHLSRRADHARALWALIVLSEWFDWLETRTSSDDTIKPNQNTQEGNICSGAPSRIGPVLQMPI